MLIFIRLMNGKAVPMDIDASATIYALKEAIQNTQGVPAPNQRLIFAGQVLKDDATLSACNVTKECSIQLFASVSRAEGEEKGLDHQEGKVGEIVQKTRGSQDLEGGGANICDALKHGEIVIGKLIEARNLVKADFWTGSSDPYVIFVLGSNSAKSKTIKRNVNPVWNETFGFRIKEDDKNAVLSMLVFDFDNFTPDDFIGSAEINLSDLPRGELVDRWIRLDNVKTGELHLQFQRCIITSPNLNTVLAKLITLERSWDEVDLSRCGITLEQITGKVAWNTKDCNPALDHLTQSIAAGRIEWVTSSLDRVEKILHTQNMLPTRGFPTRHLWISGLSNEMSCKQLLDRLERIAVVKQLKFSPGQGFAFADYRCVDDALLSLLELQGKKTRKRQLTVGFGMHMSKDHAFVTNCLKGGFVKVNIPPETEWLYTWLFLTDSKLFLFRNINSDDPTLALSVKDCFVCSQGLNSVEIYDSKSKMGIFLQSENDSEMDEWKYALRNSKNGSGYSAGVKEGQFEDYRCTMCNESRWINEIYVRDAIDTPGCVHCLRAMILSNIDGGSCKELSSEFTLQDIRELLNPKEFEKYLEISLSELLDADSSFVKCPSCNIAVEFVSGSMEDSPDFERLIGLDKKPLSSDAQQHYLQNRLRCRNPSCSTNFCRSCMEIPYHCGFDCHDYKFYKVADHCRFCDTALMPKVKSVNPPSDALINVCNANDCLQKRDKSCLKVLPCGCPCGGIRGEKECLPCLDPNHSSADVTQDKDDFCNICMTESIASAPCIQLECSHIFHFDCVKRRIEEGWSSAQITFGFASCPLCKIRICHPELDSFMDPIKALHKDIELKSYARAEYEHLLQDSEIVDQSGKYYRNAAGFSMDHFAFYMCFKCKNPYFGGQPRCNDGLDRFDPAELICGSCSGVGVEECPKHGKDYIIFKCRFCCSPSSWYCWGTTHFCDDCHRRQEAHDYMTTKTADQLPQCNGPDQCPLRIEHPPNGVEFSLGCGLCKGGSSTY